MARSLPYFTFILYLFICKLDFGQCVEVILGDPFTFPEIGNCTGEVTLIHQIGPHSSLQVAGRMQGVWKPRDGYKDRINETPFIHFIRTVYNDAGVYEFICANSNKQSPQIIQLDIVRAEKPSVKEGDAVKLECYYHTVVKRVESVWWTKHGEFVFERHFSSGGDKYGPGHERKVSMSPEGYEEGDLSLLLQRAQMEDEGVYRCYVHTADEGGRRNEASVAAVRLTVNKGASDQTNATTQPLTPNSPEDTAKGTGFIIGSTAAFLIVALLFTLFGWCLKSRCSNVSSDPGEASEPLNAQPLHPPPHPHPPEVNFPR